METRAIIIPLALCFGLAPLAGAVAADDYARTVETFRASPVVADFFNN